MPKTKVSNCIPIFTVALSIFILASLTLFLIIPTSRFAGNFPYTAPLVGMLYVTTCILGICAVFYPTQCQRTLAFKKDHKAPGDQTLLLKAVQLKGHHPDCSEFEANRIVIGKTVLCAACSGLLVGAIVALAGAFLYFFMGYNFLWADPKVLVAGNVGMILGLLQFRFSKYSKLVVNAFFVICSLLILVITDMLSKSLLLDLYAFCSIAFLLTTRIVLSDWNNKKTCIDCGLCV
ncbi:MAG TPA: hypothetical protein VLV84_03425 [Candidatus Acidoferrales bacterium]|nr:hypothetical protein [Candidatus Acidoferrales bacterium]